jgi:hypothetical protein
MTTAEGTTCLDWLTAAVEALLVGHEHEVAQEGMELRDRAFDRSDIRFFSNIKA